MRPHSPSRFAVVAMCTALALAGCSGGGSKPTPSAAAERLVAPIVAGLSSELLSKESDKNHMPPEEAVFVRVDPDRCGGAAIEVDPPFLMHDPVSVNSGSWVDRDHGEADIEEIVAVYHADFNAEATIAASAQILDSCQGTPFTIYQRHQRTGVFTLLPRKDSGSPNIVIWSFNSPTRGWACDNAMIAAYNAAVELTTCAYTNGFDVLSLAEAALARINKLAKPLD